MTANECPGDAVISQFVQAITNTSKPTTDHITSREGKMLLREFHKLIIRRGALYSKVTYGDVERLQLVLPSAFREKAMTCSHNGMEHLGREHSTDVLR